MEAHFLSLEQEIDLFYKQVAELARFNEEVREYEKAQNIMRKNSNKSLHLTSNRYAVSGK